MSHRPVRVCAPGVTCTHADVFVKVQDTPRHFPSELLSAEEWEQAPTWELQKASRFTLHLCLLLTGLGIRLRLPYRFISHEVNTHKDQRSCLWFAHVVGPPKALACLFFCPPGKHSLLTAYLPKKWLKWHNILWILRHFAEDDMTYLQFIYVILRLKLFFAQNYINEGYFNILWW